MNIIKRAIALTRWQKIKISYGITVYNEAEELNSLLTFLCKNISYRDEIIVLSDKENVTQEVSGIINSFISDDKRIKHISHPLNQDFATYKNHLISEASGDYLFQIDADEMPNIRLLKNIRYQLAYYKEYDCLKIPRINIVHGLTDEYIEKNGWHVDAQGRVNYPDFQMRLFRLNKGIEWKNKVHEILINCKKIKNLPYSTDENCLFHIKNMERQEKQNDLYDKIAEQ